MPAHFTMKPAHSTAQLVYQHCSCRKWRSSSWVVTAGRLAALLACVGPRMRVARDEAGGRRPERGVSGIVDKDAVAVLARAVLQALRGPGVLRCQAGRRRGGQACSQRRACTPSYPMHDLIPGAVCYLQISVTEQHCMPGSGVGGRKHAFTMCIKQVRAASCCLQLPQLHLTASDRCLISHNTSVRSITFMHAG